MLNFGGLITPLEDLDLLRSLVKDLHNRKHRNLTGIELGPWLGRSTLAILAPDLPIGIPNRYEVGVYDLMTMDFKDLGELWQRISVNFDACGPTIPIETVKRLLVMLFAHRVGPKKRYFEKLWCVDTWGGIESEKTMFFRESITENPRHTFLRNVQHAGFGDVVEALQGDSSVLSQLTGEVVDFVFVDADHEYESLAEDLFAVRKHIDDNTLLCGHDVTLIDRWPGVRMAVDQFVKYYRIEANCWIAEKEGVEHLQSLPDYSHFAEDVKRQQVELNRRYRDPAYRAKHGLPPLQEEQADKDEVPCLATAGTR